MYNPKGKNPYISKTKETGSHNHPIWENNQIFRDIKELCQDTSVMFVSKEKPESTVESNLIFAVLCFSEEGQAINTATKKTGKNVNVKKKCWCTLRLLSETGDRLKCSLLILGSVSWANSMIPSNLIKSVNCVLLTMG